MPNSKEEFDLEPFEIKENRIRNEILNFENKGFLFLQAWQISFYTPDRFKLPSGKILDELELLNYFENRRPEFGNKEHIEVRDALLYYNLINSELFTDRFGYESFLDIPDEYFCFLKYELGLKVKFS